MKKVKIGLIIAGFLLVCGLVYEGCREIKEILNPKPPSNRDSLKDGEKEKLIIDSNGDIKKIKRGKDGKTQIEKINTGSERVELVIKDDGTVEYRTKTFGFLFEPGVSVSIDEGPLLVGIDSRLLYWKNLGVIGGLAVDPDNLNKLRLYTGVSYRLPFSKFRNTSVWIGYNNRKAIQTGIRIKF